MVDAERDTGWSANNTLSGTRTLQALKDVPASIDAITADFIEDLNLFTADELANHVANVYAMSHFENQADQDGWAFRGLSQWGNITRNYFRWYIATDNYNVERIDFGKGSNSLIFGESEPGGQGSVFTKRAQMRNFGQVFAQYGSEDAYRFQIDLNRKLREGLAFRFNAVRRQEKTFQDFSTYGYEGEHLTATWQPFRNTQLRVEGERGDYDNARGWGSIAVREQSARSLGFTAAGGWWYTSDGELFSQAALPVADRTAANGAAGGALSLREGSYIDVVMRNAAGQPVGTKRVGGFPRNTNIRGSFDNFQRPFGAIAVYLEQRIGKLGIELAYSHQNQKQIRNDTYFSNTISMDVNGRLFGDASGIDNKTFAQRVDAYRMTAAYQWEPMKWMRQLFVASGEYTEDFGYRYITQLYNWATIDNGTARSLATNQRVLYRMYLDDPRFYSKELFDSFLVENLPTTGAFHPRQYATPGLNTGTNWRQASAASVSATGTYFQGKVQSLLGVRWNWNKELEYKDRRRDEFNQSVVPPHPQDAREGDYVMNPDLHVSHTSYSAGLTYAVTRGINAYAVYSTSFRWQDARTFDNKAFRPITGKTQEIGIKTDILKNRLTLTLAAFNIDRENVEYRWVPSTFGVRKVEDLMNPNDLSSDAPGYLIANHDSNQFRDVLSTETSRGFDLTLIARPITGLQLRVALGRVDVATNPDFSSFRAFYDAAVKRGGEDPALLADAKNILDTNDLQGRPNGARAAPWSGSWAVDYGFSRAAWKPLRGVRMGANGVWRDNYRFGVNRGVEYFGGATHTIGAYMMRDQKIWGQQVRVRLGGKYLDDLINGNVRKNGLVTRADGSAAYTYIYIMPPMLDLTLSVKF